MADHELGEVWHHAFWFHGGLHFSLEVSLFVFLDAFDGLEKIIGNGFQIGLFRFVIGVNCLAILDDSLEVRPVKFSVAATIAEAD